MNAFDRDLQQRVDKLGSIEARLARYDKTVRLGLICLLLMGAVVLGLLVYLIAHH